MNPLPPAQPYPKVTDDTAPARQAPGTVPVGSDVVSGLGSREVDLELMRWVQQRDDRALGALYDRWFPIVNALVARMLKSAGDVEDVVEETFWQAWRQADRFDGERGSVQTWLVTIARSRALDRLRAMRRTREDPVDAPELASAPDDRTTPDVDAELSERRKLVRAALKELPAEQREALELGYFAGLSQTEIAERTGQPLGTVKTRMRLAAQKLRERLSLLREDAR